MVDAIVVTHDSAATIQACLESLLAQDPAPNIIVVDSESTDDTVARVRGMGVRVVEAENRGFGASCNLGVSHGTAALVCMLNPDAVLAPGSLRRMTNTLEAFAHESTAVMVGPGFGEMDPARDENYRIWWLPSGLAFRKRLARTDTAKPFRRVDGGTVYEAPRVSGAAMLMPRDRFEQLGGFDERFFLYFEDADLSVRAKKAGLRLIVDPRARVDHIAGHSTGRLRDISVIQAQSNLWFVLKHRGRGLAIICAFDLALTTLLYGTLEIARGDFGTAWQRGLRLKSLARGLRPPAARPSRSVD